MSKRPAFQFYPSDWRTEQGLRLCSLAARGLWIEMMCLMHEATPYGHLTSQGRPLQPSELAKLVGESASSVKRWIGELEHNDVFSRDTDGVIFSRRMVRDERVREARAAGGEAGRQFGKLGAEHGAKGGRPRKENPPIDDHGRGVFNPPPSSSTSSSSSELILNDSTQPPAREAVVVEEDLLELTNRLALLGGVPHAPSRLTSFNRNLDVVKRWRVDGVDPELVARIIRERTADTPDTPVASLGYFDQAVRKAHAVEQAGGAARPVTPIPEAPPLAVADAEDAALPSIRERLRREVADDRLYDGWLGPDQVALSLNGVGLIVTARSPFAVEWIEGHFLEQLRRAAETDVVVRAQPGMGIAA